MIEYRTKTENGVPVMVTTFLSPLIRWFINDDMLVVWYYHTPNMSSLINKNGPDLFSIPYFQCFGQNITIRNLKKWAQTAIAYQDVSEPNTIIFRSPAQRMISLTAILLLLSTIFLPHEGHRPTWISSFSYPQPRQLPSFRFSGDWCTVLRSAPHYV